MKHQNEKQRVPTTERLAKALEEAEAPGEMVEAARNGLYDDFKSPHPTPIVLLVQHLGVFGNPKLKRLLLRVMGGEFDAPSWEAREWARSAEGRATFQEYKDHLEDIEL